MSTQRGFTLIELLIVIAIIGIIAAIAIPSLLRARVSANEAALVGDVRTIISAEAAYHGANQGFYGILSCLSSPWDPGCITGYPVGGTTFLDQVLTIVPAPRSGYVRDANYGFVGPNAGDRASYCYQGRPVAWNRTGVRSIAGDSSAIVGAALADINCCLAGALVAACPQLR